MKIYGLIGYPLSHSFSKKYFSNKFIESGINERFQYENFELKNIYEFQYLIFNNKDLWGLNVTIPYKQSIIPFLNNLIGSAREIEAVNTIKIERDSDRNVISLSGYNTDIIGFDKTITPLLDERHSGALILGTGGASKAVAFVFNLKKIPFVYVSRNEGNDVITYDQIDQELLLKYPVIVNTTPLGTFPDVQSFPPIPYDLLGSNNLLYDLVYNPSETQFMHFGKIAGAKTCNGYNMLVEQAEASWQIWNS